MASNWPRVRVSDVCELIVDCVNKTAPVSPVPTPYKMIRTPNIKNGRVSTDDCRCVDADTFAKWTRRATVERNDVLLTREAPLGEVGIVNSSEQLFLGQRIMQYRADQSKLDPHFLLYSFLSPDLQHQFSMHEGSGSVVSHIRVGDCSKFELNLPPLAMQKRISEILRNLDNRITLNHQINQTLELMAQTLFKSWFVDFDPVMDNALDAGNPIPDELQHRAEARQAVRESEDFKPLPDDVRQLFPDAFEESELGWVPKGWVVSTAGDEFTVKGGSTPSTKSAEFWEGGDIHWTSPKDLSGKAEKILLDTERKITTLGLRKITSGLLPPETVLMSSRAPVGYLAMTKVPVAINQGYIAITESKSLTQEFALYWLNSKIEMIKSISGGTTFAEISKKTFRTIPIVVPSAQSANAFSETVALYLNKISKNVEECSSLGALRDSLLPKLISGELEII
ncbi:TPA: restriction endonuclease subunit S [Vibrio vulnificus]|nr:restriction endonuclease subunit S [Vibrio vulnificus]